MTKFYNIEIFESESYQKILKEVLKFRYPDLSYKEALEREEDYDNNIGGYWSEYNDFGRPITIGEIVRIISNLKAIKDSNFDGFVDFIAHNKGYTVAKNGILWFEWNLFNYLHEQPQEVIDMIAELIPELF